MALTPKQQRFVEEYCTDWNATQAARRAGYRAKRADQAGYQLLRKAEIQAAIQARQQTLHQQCAVTQERVIAELSGIGFSDLRTYVRWGPDGVRLEPSTTLSASQTRVVKQIVQTITKDGSTLRLTLHDKVSALDKLARYLKLYEGPEDDAPFGKGMLGLLEAREALKAQLDTLAAKARANGQGDGGLTSSPA
jgi:phage terminase small subunit